MARNLVEHEHQKALVAWAWQTKIPPGPDVEEGATLGAYLFAIPNGGGRSKAEAGRLKAEGVKAGVSDLFLPLQRQGCAGLWLELKAPKKKPTPDQRAWLVRMARAGYRAEWRDDWLAAAVVLADYIGVPAPVRRIPTQQRGSLCSV